MSHVPFRSILLPAVLVSSTVFSALTLPIVLLKPGNASSPLPASVQQSFQPVVDVLESGNKGLVIRYIGVAIVASVGAGVVTAEVKRKLGSRSDSTTDASEMAHDSFESTETYEQDLAFLKAASKYSAIDLSEIEGPTADSLLDEPETPATVWVDEPGFDSLLAEESSSDTLGAMSDGILREPQHYQMCRIQLPQVERRFFAILVQGDYYRLFRSRKTHAKALHLLHQLRDRNMTAVITEIDQHYSVWVKEPDAYQISA